MTNPSMEQAGNETSSGQANRIAFDDFAKVEMKIGRILSADMVEGSEKLLKLSVDFGEDSPRQVVSGIAKQFVVIGKSVQEGDEGDAEQESEIETKTISGLVGHSFVFVTNLEPRKILGLESQAMIVAGTGDAGLALMSPTIDLPPGTSLS